MLKIKRGKIIKLIILAGDAILDTKLVKKLEIGYRESNRGVVMKEDMQREELSGEGYMAWDKESKELLRVDSIYPPT